MSTVLRPAGRLFAGLRDRVFVVRRAAHLFDFKTARTSSRRHPKLRPVVVCCPHCLRPREPQAARLRRSDGPAPGLFAAVPAATSCRTASGSRPFSHVTSSIRRSERCARRARVPPSSSTLVGRLPVFTLGLGSTSRVQVLSDPPPIGLPHTSRPSMNTAATISGCSVMRRPRSGDSWCSAKRSRTLRKVR